MTRKPFPWILPSQGDGSARRAQTIAILAGLKASGWADNELQDELELRGFKSRTASEYIRIADLHKTRKHPQIVERRTARGGKHPENSEAFEPDT